MRVPECKIMYSKNWREPTAGAPTKIDGVQTSKALAASGHWIRVRYALQFCVVPITLLGLWEVSVRLGWISPQVLAAPSAIGLAILQEARRGTLWVNTAVTLKQVGIGYGCAILAAVPAGLILGSSRLVRRLLTSTLELLRPVPPIALIPVTILWLGIGDASKVFIIAYAAVWPILLNTILGADSLPPILHNTSRALGLSKFDYFLKVVIPSSVPQIMVGLRVAGAIAFVVVVAAEMVAASSGLGFQILNAERTFRTPDMFAGIVVLSVLGALVNIVLLKMEKMATRWR